jgi:hypothetical protein
MVLIVILSIIGLLKKAYMSVCYKYGKWWIYSQNKSLIQNERS